MQEAQQPSGMRRFVIESRHAESDAITSFVLRPEDGAAPLAHIAGQHLTLWVTIPGEGRHKRNYTISSAPNGETWRISVKREPQGCVSRWLHDHGVVGTVIEVGPASGAFVLPRDACRPIVMLSAGVGLTPMIAMLEQAVAERLGAPIHVIHVARNGATHAFSAHQRELAAKGADVSTTFFYSQPGADDEKGRDYDVAGRPTAEWLIANTPIGEAEYFVCGPLDFLRDMASALAKAGVPPERLHYEFFGEVEDLFGETESVSSPQPVGVPDSGAPHEARATGPFTREIIGNGLLDSAADAVIASDREGLIVLWNAGATRIFGFSEDEALGQSLDIIIPEPFRQRHWDGYHETVSTGQSRYGAGDMLAVPGLARDGRRLSLEFTIVLLKDDEGAVTGMASVLRDVTKRFEETRALKKQIAALQEASGGS